MLGPDVIEDECRDDETKKDSNDTSARVGVTFQEAVYSVRIGTTGYRAIAADVFLDKWFA